MTTLTHSHFAVHKVTVNSEICATVLIFAKFREIAKIVSEYGQEIPQSQTADNPWHHEEEPLNHHGTPGRQTKQSNQLSVPPQDDCITRMDIK